MKEYKQFYIDGAWVDPVEPRTLEIENPATEENFAVISIGSKADVDKAVAAARKAFPAFSQTSVEYRAERKCLPVWDILRPPQPFCVTISSRS